MEVTSPSDSQSAAEKAEEFWGTLQTADPQRGYWSHPYLGETIAAKTNGQWYLEYVRDKYFGGKPARCALSVGCGAGEIDRIAFKRKIFSKLVGVDFSAKGIDVARQAAQADGMPVEYVRADFNSDKLPDAEQYDLIYDYASSHHVSNLEHLMMEIERVLADDGYFVLYGYCGPARMQWPPLVIEVVNELLSRMPLQLRSAMPVLGRPSIWEFMSADPSEAVRGPEVVDVTRAFFDVIEEIDYGCSLSHPMFAQNAFQMNPNDAIDQALFQLICEFEQILVAHGILRSDMKLMVCRRR